MLHLLYLELGIDFLLNLPLRVHCKTGKLGIQILQIGDFLSLQRVVFLERKKRNSQMVLKVFHWIFVPRMVH